MNHKPLFLAVTLVALLIIGGVFWVMEKRPVATHQSVVTKPVAEAPIQTEPEKYPQHIETIPGDTDEVWYNIPELGIRMKLNKEFAEDLIYSTEMTDDFGEKSSGIFFSTKGITEVAPECAPETGNALGSVFKAEGNMVESAKTDEYLAARIDWYTQIGDYYYGWVGHQALCAYSQHVDAAKKEWPKNYNGLGAKNMSEGSKTFQLIP